ncbi:MAG: peptidase S10, partial [Glaciecola sp.]|nr:peptidase S10 [Glaciecola sp.]
MRVFKLCLILLCLNISTFPALASIDETPNPIPELTQSITEHSGTFNGKKITYFVHAGDHFLYDDKHAPKANIYSTAYFANSKKGKADPTRPLLFIFNGGPGSSSVWLHMGVFGPKRVDIPSDGEAVGAPPYKLEHNALSLIDIADMVFIDPVGTGYS